MGKPKAWDSRRDLAAADSFTILGHARATCASDDHKAACGRGASGCHFDERSVSL